MKASRARTAGDVSVLGAGLAAAGAALKRRTGLIIPIAGVGGAGGAAGYITSNAQNRKADRWGESARKIRARGFQRLEDESVNRGVVGNVGKALRVPFGGSVASRVINRNGKMYLRRGFAAPRRWA